MKKAVEQIHEAEDMIQEFTSKFYDKFGFWPVVKFNINSFFIPPLSLSQAEEIVNDMFKKHAPEAYPAEGIRSKLRRQQVVLHRQIFFKIARESGYGFKAIGEFVGFDHATVLHSNTNIRNKLEIKDMEVVRTYNLIKNEIQDRHGDDGNVQHDPNRTAESQSVLLSLLQERERESGKHQPSPGDKNVRSYGIPRQRQQSPAEGDELNSESGEFL
jgi:hypothetical protein